MTAQEIFNYDPDRPSCHASSIIELPDYDLLCAWYAGSYELAEDVAILYSRLRYGDTKWSTPELLVDIPNRSMGNPVFFVDSSGILWLFFVAIYNESWAESKVKYIKSADAAKSWSKPKVLLEELGWMVRNHPVVLSNSNILLPIYDERDWSPAVLISEDDGKSWRLKKLLAPPSSESGTNIGLIQPTVVELEEGKLLMYLRSDSGYIWEATSSDYGETWSSPQQTHLPNPNSSIELVKLTDGRLVLAYNHSKTARTNLSLSISEDCGKTWLEKFIILEEGLGEYSYPSIIQAKRDNKIHITYTNQRQNIKYAAIQL